MALAENVLKRKLTRGGVVRSPLPETDFIGETFARQIEEAFRPLVKTMVSAMVLECKIIKLSTALQELSVPMMLGLIDVEDAKTQGLLSIDTDLTYHLIDLMLGGDPGVGGIPITRSFTSIDMALCKLPLEALVTAFTSALSTCFGKPMNKSVTIAGQRQDITQVRIAPDYVDVLVYNMALDIGDAARSGNLHLFLPLATLDVIRAAMHDDEAVVVDDRPQDLCKTQMRKAAANAPVVVNAVLQRRKMKISDLNALKPGDLLPLPHGAHNEVQLRLTQPGGKTVEIALGRLGAYQGSKVIKLDNGVDDRVRDQLQYVIT